MLRSLDNPDDLARYLRLKADRRALDAEIAALEPTIYAALLDEDGATADVPAPDGRAGFTLALRTRRTWEYSDAVTALDGELKALRRYEEKARLARCVKAAGYVVVTRARPPADSAPRPALRARSAVA
ncbi:MAG TPA: hypothetical protein VGB53_05780 [Rubricoccaceae bacterium]|jgi:hypothetical protein